MNVHDISEATGNNQCDGCAWRHAGSDGAHCYMHPYEPVFCGLNARRHIPLMAPRKIIAPGVDLGVCSASYTHEKPVLVMRGKTPNAALSGGPA